MIQLLSPRALDSTAVLDLPFATQGSLGLVQKRKRIRRSIGPRNSAEEKVVTPLAVGKIIIQSPPPKVLPLTSSFRSTPPNHM
jgi:hypothetical protein